MNKESEIRNGYEVTALTKQVWAVQMEIAKQILEVCNRHNLKVWADWGTLLGMVREKGFIPWDDDIDLMMMRSDYDKLLKIAPDEFKAPFHFQSPYTEKDYYRGHAQVRYDDTTAILPEDLNQPFHQGIFVDIFVYDNVPDTTGWQWKRTVRRATLDRKILLTARYGSFFLKKPVKSVKYIFSRLLCGLFGPMNIYRHFERQFTNYNTLDLPQMACPAFDLKRVEKEKRDKRWYDETIMMPFEDIMLPAPAGYDMVLRNLYGDNYMQPAKSPSGHGETIFDVNRSYKEVIPLIKAGNFKQESNS